MNATQIARTDLSKLDIGLLEAREQLSAKAAKLFGTDTRIGYEDKITQPYGSITRALKKLEINPLEYFDVQAYKASKESQSIDERVWYTLVWLVPALTLFVAAFLHMNWEAGSFYAMLLPAVALGICTLIAWNETTRVVHTWGWHKYNMAAFKHAIPDYAMMKAVALKEVLPNVTFQVESLERTTERSRSNWEEARQRRRDSDPFLIAVLGEEVVYLDVWDEADFKIR